MILTDFILIKRTNRLKKNCLHPSVTHRRKNKKKFFFSNNRHVFYLDQHPLIYTFLLFFLFFSNPRKKRKKRIMIMTIQKVNIIEQSVLDLGIQLTPLFCQCDLFSFLIKFFFFFSKKVLIQ